MSKFHFFIRTGIFSLLISSTFPVFCQSPSKYWPRHTIDNTSTGADGIKLADFNQDGLIWLDGQYFNQQEKPIFHSISGAHIAKYDRVELLDIDADGDLDILICEENYGANSIGLGVIWYENVYR